MKFVHPEIGKVFDTECGCVHSLIIENQAFFRRLLTELYEQTNGYDGQCIVSINDAPVACARHAEIIGSFVPFEMNRKPLLTKIASALEKRAASSEYWEKTGGILMELTAYLEELAFDFPCDIRFDKLGINGMIKAASPELRDDYTSLGEKIIDYMELVRTFDRDKLFFMVNLRAYIDDAEMNRLIETILAHGYHVLLLESSERPRLEREERWIIDVDLCEID